MKYIIKVGNLVATLLMFTPLIIIACYKSFETLNFIIFLVCSVCYDIYYYSIIQFDQYMEEQKKLYENVQSGKAIESKTTEQKEKWFMTIGITTFEEYFKNK